MATHRKRKQKKRSSLESIFPKFIGSTGNYSIRKLEARR